MNDDDFRNAVTHHVAEGGWSGISAFVDLVDIETLREEYYFLDDEFEKNGNELIRHEP